MEKLGIGFGNKDNRISKEFEERTKEEWLIAAKDREKEEMMDGYINFFGKNKKTVKDTAGFAYEQAGLYEEAKHFYGMYNRTAPLFNQELMDEIEEALVKVEEKDKK
jgi:hypothetical protein